VKAPINRSHPHWPAACQMAMTLGYAPVFIQRGDASSDAWRLFWRSVQAHPVQGLVRGWLALEIYWECVCYIQYILHQAEALRNPENRELVDQIVAHCMEDLSANARGGWGELSGLAVQKLRHIVFYEDVKEYAAVFDDDSAGDDPEEPETIE